MEPPLNHRRPLLLAALLLGLAAAAPAAPTDSGAPGLLSPTGALLDACLDDYNRLDFDRSEAEARQAMALQPEHPLPVIYLLGALNAALYEQTLPHRVDPALLRRFDEAEALAARLEAAWEAQHHDGWSQLYIGNSLGAEGLVDLYRGQHLRAYKVGRRANAALKLAQQRLPGLADADLGLGQYLYYCGRLSGILRFFLVLHGDIPGGIRLLSTCGASGCRSALLARLVLARILTEEAPDFGAALPYVQEAYARYPGNYACFREAMEEAQGLGLADPHAQALAASLRAQWRAGWRPPDYATFDPSRFFADVDRQMGAAE